MAYNETFQDVSKEISFKISRQYITFKLIGKDRRKGRKKKQNDKDIDCLKRPVLI